jgi:hypothetical protein
MRRGLAQARNVRHANDIGPFGECAAQLAAQISGGARQKQTPEGLTWCGFGLSRRLAHR